MKKLKVLAGMKEGESGIVFRINASLNEKNLLFSKGLMEGSRITVTSLNPSVNPELITVLVQGTTQVVLSFEEALKIVVAVDERTSFWDRPWTPMRPFPYFRFPWRNIYR